MLGRLGAGPVSSASRCKKSDQSSARLSLLFPPSMSDGSVLSDGVLGVLLKGDSGIRRLANGAAPGRDSPACSFCSGSIVSNDPNIPETGLPSSQFKSPAMICSTWNFFTSDRSMLKKRRKWFVTTCLDFCQKFPILSHFSYRLTISSGFCCLMNRRAFVRCSLSTTPSWRSFPIKRVFSLT